ncbi:MAG: dUTP diphosphatase [bacterium]|nr:dUTP diphosphatase [bacterium]
MNVKIKRIDTSLPLPTYQTPGSVAFDLYARLTTTVTPWKPTIIPANVVIEVPEGYFLMLSSRSSTPMKKGLMVANGIGVIDQDYNGDEDEIGVQVLNFTKKDVIISKGERIAQALLVKIAKVVEFDEVEQMSSTSRGGFGSTG